MPVMTLKMNGSNFLNFVDKLQDLASISDVIKLKINSETILAYSMISNDVSVLALKNYSLITSDYIENFKEDKNLDYIVIGASKFVKNLKFFNIESTIKLEIDYKQSEDILHVRSAKFSNGKLKISCIGGELSKIRDITKSILDTRLDSKLSKWGFRISKSDFLDIKRLSNINSEDKILSINVEAGKVSVSEDHKWELDVDQIDSKNNKLIFNKKYLTNINDSNDLINFEIFETFILVKDDNSNLMLSFESDFSNED